MVGSLIPLKNHSNVINTIKITKNCHLTIAGDGPERLSLQELVHYNSISTKVDFIGHVENLDNIYQSHDILIVASITEAFPLVTLEAASFGLPIIGSNIPALKSNKLISEFFNPFSPTCIKQAIYKVSSNYTLCSKNTTYNYNNFYSSHITSEIYKKIIKSSI